MKKILTQISLKCLPFRKKTKAMPKKKKKKQVEGCYHTSPADGRGSRPLSGQVDQYSHRDDVSMVVPSPMSVPPWSPRRYLPLQPLMATRPCSTNSRKKSSGFSPSEHTRPLLETYQNLPVAPAAGWI